jgi:hypothetical protein
MTQKKGLRSYLSLSHDDQEDQQIRGDNKEQERQFQQKNKFTQDSPTYTSTGRSTRLLSHAQFHSHQVQDPYLKSAQTVSTEDVSAVPDCRGRLPRLPIVEPPGL